MIFGKTLRRRYFRRQGTAAHADVVCRSSPALNLQITIHNLLSLVRKGPATTQNKVEGIILSATLEVSSVAVHVGYIRKKPLLRLRGDIWALIERITFSLKVSANVSLTWTLNTLEPIREQISPTAFMNK